MVGVDPQKALAGGKPLFPFQFVAGNRSDAVAKLARGRFCLVPDHFARESNLGVGDKFSVVVPPAPGTEPAVADPQGEPGCPAARREHRI